MMDNLEIKEENKGQNHVGSGGAPDALINETGFRSDIYDMHSYELDKKAKKSGDSMEITR